MATLRNLIDGKSLDANATDDVFNHLKNAKKAKLKNDMANIKLQTKLAPTRKLLELVDQEHPMPGQQQQVDQNGNPVNLNNPQMDQQGNPIPNQAPPMRPGIGQPNVAKGNQNIPQKKPGFPNANKASTKDKLENDKNKKQVGGKKGVEIHVKAGGLGSGRKSSMGMTKQEHESAQRQAEDSAHQSSGKEKEMWQKKAEMHQKYINELSNSTKKIDQLNVKKKKMKGQDMEKIDYHSNPGISQMPSRGIGLSGNKKNT
jgi:hypothetical protein